MYGLSQQEIEHYHDHGYVVPACNLGANWHQRMRDAASTLKAKHAEVGHDLVPGPHVPDYAPGVTAYEPCLSFAHMPVVLDGVHQRQEETLS